MHAPLQERASLSASRLLLRAVKALLAANLRYWPTVAGQTNAQLRRWRKRAEQIEDGDLHSLAVGKIEDEHFNAQVATTLATLVARPLRREAIEAIVALEVLFDHLDGLSEGLGDDPLTQAVSILTPLRDAVAIETARTDTVPTEAALDDAAPALDDAATADAAPDDGGYVEDLVRAVREAIASLPALEVVRPSLIAAAERCVAAQAHIHAACEIGEETVRRWATADAEGGPLRWREHLAGSASAVLGMHALIVAATDPATSAADAESIARLYLCIGVMSTTLDSVIDRDDDLQAGNACHADRYSSPEELSESLISTFERAVSLSAGVPDRDHHVMTLIGVLAYYLSAPSASDPFASKVAEELRRSLRSLLVPPLLVMRAWRLGKALHLRLQRAAPRRSRS